MLYSYILFLYTKDKSYIKKLGFTIVATCSNAQDEFSIIEAQPINIILMNSCIKGELDSVETVAMIKKITQTLKSSFLLHT